jgi:hypothetical protein
LPRKPGLFQESDYPRGILKTRDARASQSPPGELTGTKAAPQIGQLPAAFERICGCAEQVHTVVAAGPAIADGPPFGAAAVHEAPAQATAKAKANMTNKAIKKMLSFRGIVKSPSVEKTGKHSFSMRRPV